MPTPTSARHRTTPLNWSLRAGIQAVDEQGTWAGGCAAALPPEYPGHQGARHLQQRNALKGQLAIEAIPGCPDHHLHLAWQRAYQQVLAWLAPWVVRIYFRLVRTCIWVRRLSSCSRNAGNPKGVLAGTGRQCRYNGPASRIA